MVKKDLGEDSFTSWNERMALKYNPHDYHTKSVFVVRFVERMRVRAILKLLSLKPEDKILEIGCGAGNILEAIPNGMAFGGDLSASLLRIAKTKTYKTHCDLLQFYGESMPFPDASFEKVYCSEVLEHVPEPSKICKEAHRLLKANGSFVISVPNEKSIDRLKSFCRKIFLGSWITSCSDEWHLHSFDLALLKETLSAYFKVMKIRWIPFRLLPMRIVVLCKKI